MRYEAAVELARYVIAQYGADAGNFELHERQNPVLADHDEPVYDVVYQQSGRTLQPAIAEAAADPRITVKLPGTQAGSGSDDSVTPLDLQWTSPVDDVVSFHGRIAPTQRSEQVIEGTIRTGRRTAVATFNTAERGRIHRVTIVAEPTGKTYRGTESVELAYTLSRDGDEVDSHAEEFITDKSVDALVKAWVPDDEHLAHTLAEFEATAVNTA